ncbi:hypothetical protein ABTL82_20180, partial [Acinetobacter baumannii]
EQPPDDQLRGHAVAKEHDARNQCEHRKQQAERRDAAEALVRALVAAARHFVDPQNWSANAAILARPEYLDGSATLI